MKFFFTTSFPTDVDSFTNPSAGQPLNNPDQATLVSKLNDAMLAVETRLGKTGSADTNSDAYKLSAVSGVAKALTSGVSTQSVTGLTLISPLITVSGDATGDIYYRDAGGAFQRLPIGSAGQILSVSSGLPAWIANPSAGDASYTDKGIVKALTSAAVSGLTVSSGVINVNMGTGANQVVQLDASAKLPAVDGSQLTNLSRPFYQTIAVGGGSLIGMGGDSTGTNVYIVQYATASTYTIYRFAQDATTKQYYYMGDSYTFTTSATVTTSLNCGIVVIGSYVYVSINNKVDRFTSTNLAAGGTELTISGTAPSGSNTTAFTNGTDLIVNDNSTTTWYRYTISGTTITNAATLTGPSGRLGAWSDGSNAYFWNSTAFTKWPLTLTSQTSSLTLSLYGMATTSAGMGLFYASPTAVYLGQNNTTGSSAISLFPITKP